MNLPLIEVEEIELDQIEELKLRATLYSMMTKTNRHKAMFSIVEPTNDRLQIGANY